MKTETKATRGGRKPGAWRPGLTADSLRTFREKNHVSRARLAKMIGVSPTTIQNWEAGLAFPTDRNQDGLQHVMKNLDAVQVGAAVGREEDAMSTKSINEPHKPSCACLRAGHGPCDCGAMDPAQPRLTLSLGLRSVELLLRAVNRLDTDDQREAASLGLVGVLAEWTLANRPPSLEDHLRELRPQREP